MAEIGDEITHEGTKGSCGARLDHNSAAAKKATEVKPRLVLDVSKLLPALVAHDNCSSWRMIKYLSGAESGGLPLEHYSIVVTASGSRTSRGGQSAPHQPRVPRVP
jgi:hypothetical protein